MTTPQPEQDVRDPGAPTPARAPTATAKLVVNRTPRPIQNKVECVTAANMVMAQRG